MPGGSRRFDGLLGLFWHLSGMNPYKCGMVMRKLWERSRTKSVSTEGTCRSELARDSGVSGTGDVGFAGPIASRLAPTVLAVEYKVFVHRRNLWERA